MLLCCFREPKPKEEANDGIDPHEVRPLKKKRNRGHYEANLAASNDLTVSNNGEKRPQQPLQQPANGLTSADVVQVAPPPYSSSFNNSASRPLKTTTTTSLHYSPVSTSSNGGEAEVLVAQVTYHSRPRHSVTSSESSSFFRPPSRDGSDRRDKLERAPLAKEAKRLMKQRSQEKITTTGPGGSIPFIDASPPNATSVPTASPYGNSAVYTSYASPSTSTEASPHHKGKPWSFFCQVNVPSPEVETVMYQSRAASCSTYC